MDQSDEFGEADLQSFVNFYLHNDYHQYYLTGNERTSRQSINRLLDHQLETTARVLVNLLNDEDLLLAKIVFDENLNPIIRPTILSRITLEDCIWLIVQWVEEFANELLAGLDEN